MFDRPKPTVGCSANGRRGRRRRRRRRITKATVTHSGYITFLFYGNSGYANAPECFVMRTLPVLYKTRFPRSPNMRG